MTLVVAGGPIRWNYQYGPAGAHPTKPEFAPGGPVLEVDVSAGQGAHFHDEFQRAAVVLGVYGIIDAENLFI